jgi:hypothetical protein
VTNSLPIKAVKRQSRGITYCWIVILSTKLIWRHQKMDKKQLKTGRNRNKLTTNNQVADMALTLWECSEYITKTTMRTNLNSYFRDRLARLVRRLQKEAIDLGNDLAPANQKAFVTSNATKLIARQLGLLD